MNTTKKNGFLKAAGLMLAVMMLATCVLSGTMAKYSSSSKDIALEATIAKWKITANSDDISKLVSLDNGFTIYDTVEAILILTRTSRQTS